MMLEGQVAVISGVGPGVGQELASVFSGEGASVVLVARDASRLDDVGREVERRGGRALWISADIGRDEDCQRVAARTLERFGRVDILVNNAFQMGPWGSLMETSFDDAWSVPFEVNVKGSLRMTQALLAPIEERKGAVVMVNTVAMRSYHPRVGCYSIAKGALQSATRILALELASRGVRVNAVIPGYIDGPPLRNAFATQAAEEGVSAEEIYRRVADSLPLRMIPTSRDVAEAILFLASPRARAITGAALDVNAGEYVPL